MPRSAQPNDSPDICIRSASISEWFSCSLVNREPLSLIAAATDKIDLHYSNGNNQNDAGLAVYANFKAVMPLSDVQCITLVVVGAVAAWNAISSNAGVQIIAIDARPDNKLLMGPALNMLPAGTMTSNACIAGWQDKPIAEQVLD